ncbi:hypothetical protein NEOLEDRAFT_1157903 [Neolentinus lepideus HHB14362 ss-1]|uniref:GYF domain-containing protein n=1 Tax=Neolentinus lepideus HHB14362 ss-1 TaxID=1314782 RepID=A0A165Q9M2_9AGAM|nr:hypothetical protein NEOLEDRAFT_1157903 [Neolentinus lepideus HHB14362 ss-1]
MTAATLQFGPEWMRTKPQTPRSQAAPSPPPQSNALPTTSSYSSLVAPAPQLKEEKRDSSKPFKYSKEDMLRIYKEGGGRGGLGLEVERWEGIVREVSSEPAALREWTEAEKKLFTGSLNSEMRRRQSTDYLGTSSTTSLTGERPRLTNNGSGGVSPMRERFGSLMGRRRGDSTDQQPSVLPRKLSMSGIHGSLNSPRDGAMPSPRTRAGFSPGFDGVLNGGEGWNLRRRPSEGPLRTANSSIDHGSADLHSDNQQHKIKEEEESAEANGGSSSGTQDSTVNGGDSSPAENAPRATLDTTDPLENGITDLSLGNSTDHYTVGGLTAVTQLDPVAVPPPGLTDLASIEWSYLDPQGQIQGPFRADVMQKWHSDGYFTPKLLMKRTHIDLDWTSVGELTRRAGGGPIFLTPLAQSTAPPGLPRRSEPSLDQLMSPRDPTVVNQPYQPVPMRSLRTSTLDSYLNGASSTSASPSSSFGAGRFSNGSPDPAAFTNNLYSAGDPSVGIRGAIFGTPRDSLAEGQFRAGFNEIAFDSPFTHRSSPFDRNAPNRTSSMDSFNYDAVSGWANGFNGQNADNTFASSAMANNMNGLGGVRGLGEPTVGSSNSPGSVNIPYGAQRQLSGLARDVFARQTLPDSPIADNGLNDHGPTSFSPLPQAQGFPQSSSSQLGAQPTLSLPPLATALAQSTIGSHSPVAQHSQNFQHPVLSTPSQATPSSSWNVPEPSPSRRPNQFDAAVPKTGNTVANPAPSGALSSSGSVTPSHQAQRTSTNAAPPPQSQTLNDKSPWYTASRGMVEEGWGDAADSNRLTVSNLMQHNEQQRQQERIPLRDSPEPREPATLGAESSAVQPVVPVTSDKVVSKKKSSQKTIQDTLAETAAPSAVPASSTSVSVASPIAPASIPAPKAPWTIDEEKTKPSGVAMGFREIQEAEAKKLEARRAAEKEREKERLVKTAAPASTEETQPFVASWGLPTSQAGATRTTSQTPKDVAATTSPGTPATAPWTNAGNPAANKKTMKEIQEEEERRKKEAAKQKETVAAAVRRGYAETTTRSTPQTPAAIGGAWSTVGPGGKVAMSTASAVPTGRPALSTSASAASIAGSVPRTSAVVNGVARTMSSGPVPAAPKAASVLKVDETPAPPSAELLKWLSDSLKGLNTSVNLEEIISMLLSFPLDPDPSTLELISDLIYANSTTMDGRRFAADFVHKRKLDASSRTKANGAKIPSIADVVKAQPKPAQNDGWGGFKVVNKKKKGGKA